MITSQEAASVLKEADAAGRRSRQAYRYSIGAPYFFIWGPVWFVGYAATALTPAYANWVWLGLVLLGIIVSFSVGRQRKVQGYSVWRRMALLGIIYAFSAGLWLGMRYIIVGAVLAAATLGGYFFLRENFLLWMAFVGGGSLLLTGFWLRQA